LPTSFQQVSPSLRPSIKQHSFVSFSSAAGASRNDSYDEALASLPRHAQLQFDFFGEPVTFFGMKDTENKKNTTANAMAALDGFLLAVATKGRTCTGGGAEAGLEMKSAHASAIAWAELLRHAKVWNTKAEGGNDHTLNKEKKKDTAVADKFAPMLAVVAIAPVLAQAGWGYVKFLDRLLEHGDSLVPGMGPLQMVPMAEAAVQRKEDVFLNERERQHIQALEYMMNYDHPSALLLYMKILLTCPGDVLALSLAIDLANVLGDKQMAFRYVSVIVATVLHLPAVVCLHFTPLGLPFFM